MMESEKQAVIGGDWVHHLHREWLSCEHIIVSLASTCFEQIIEVGLSG